MKPDLILVGCVKTKQAQGAAARDLYVSDYFRKMRAYAEDSGAPWFILSAQHGLIAPTTWLEPYDCYLPEMSQDYRRSWGQRVATALEQTIGPVDGLVIDIHAGSAYVESARAALEPLGAVVTDERQGLSFGRRLAWYLARQKSTPVGTASTIDHLRDGSRAMALPALLSSPAAELRSPGLYSWWVDEPGAADLTVGLGHRIEPGLIYAGLAGATRKRGSTSSNTLRGRIATMHLGTRAKFSTLRRSLGSILADAHGWSTIDEGRLTEWMHAHLRVVTVPVNDADTLDDLESRVLKALDPPLNLAKMPTTPLRLQLSALRKQYGG